MWWRDAVHNFYLQRQWMCLPPPKDALAQPYFERVYRPFELTFFDSVLQDFEKPVRSDTELADSAAEGNGPEYDTDGQGDEDASADRGDQIQYHTARSKSTASLAAAADKRLGDDEDAPEDGEGNAGAIAKSTSFASLASLFARPTPVASGGGAAGAYATGYGGAYPGGDGPGMGGLGSASVDLATPVAHPQHVPVGVSSAAAAGGGGGAGGGAGAGATGPAVRRRSMTTNLTSGLASSNFPSMYTSRQTLSQDDDR